jgi:hypothetical protein
LAGRLAINCLFLAFLPPPPIVGAVRLPSGEVQFYPQEAATTGKMRPPEGCRLPFQLCPFMTLRYPRDGSRRGENRSKFVGPFSNNVGLQ